MRVKGERCREGRGRGQRRLMADTLGLENNVFILFFLSAGWLNRFGLIQFNRFQTLETETKPNRKVFVIF